MGKIRQDFTGLERQLGECKMPRLVLDGQKQIYLNEIWIATSGSISNNAKEKIHFKFSGTNIRFVTTDKLVRLISDHAPYYWFDVPNILGKYLLKLWQSNNESDKNSSLLMSFKEQFYIELDVERIRESSYKKTTPPQPVTLLSEIKKRKFMLLEGGMGSGKSKLIRNVIENLSTPESFLENRIVPIYTSYKAIVDDHGTDVRSCVQSHLGAAYSELDKKTTTFLVLIDGVDEICHEGSAHLGTLLSLVDSACGDERLKILFATRPLRLIEEEEEKLIRKVERYNIRPLSVSKIRAFVDRICTELNVSKRIIDDIRRSQLFKQLPQSPMAAILLSLLLAENAKDLPSNITELYAKALELMLGRWDIEKGLLTQKEYEASDAFCSHLARYMMENGLDQVSVDESKNMFSTYLDQRNLALDGGALFDKIVNRSGVLMMDDHKHTISYRHRSFSEFLYAKHMLRTDKLPMDERVFDYYWMNTYFFYVGLHKDCPDLIEQILAYPVNSESERWLKIINMPNYYLAGFASPYRVVEDHFHELFIDAAQLFVDAKEGRTKTNLSNYPEMHILWMLQSLLRNSYSYEFFRKAVEIAILQVDEARVEDSVKAYALFFLGVVGIELGKTSPFDYLLDHYTISELPFSLSCALKAEATLRKELKKSSLMKKHEKSLRRLTKGRDGMKDAINNLFEKPVKSLQKMDK